MRSVEDWITLLVVVGFWILLWKLDRDGHRNTAMDLAAGGDVDTVEVRAGEAGEVRRQIQSADADESDPGRERITGKSLERGTTSSDWSDESRE